MRSSLQQTTPYHTTATADDCLYTTLAQTIPLKQSMSPLKTSPYSSEEPDTVKIWWKKVNYWYKLIHHVLLTVEPLIRDPLR